MVFGLFYSLGCSVVGIRTAEELTYSLVEEHDDLEIRQYAPYIAAEASLEGEQPEVQSALFRILAGYIFGKNTTQESIAMTAPVMMEGVDGASSEAIPTNLEPPTHQSQKIAMTAPVLMKESPSAWTMAFSMPAEHTMESLPLPLDKRVRLVEVPQKTYAVIRYAGSFRNEKKRENNRRVLLEWVRQHPAYQAVGEAFYAGYDPPFTLPFLRRNEVLVEVQSP